MPKPSSIPVKFRQGFRGSFIDISQIIDKKIKVDVVDFVKQESKVRNCEFMCKMQIKINGRPFVTWHSSEVLTSYLEDCRAYEKENGEAIFPIEGMITLGEDRAYYLVDSSDGKSISESELDNIIERALRNKR